ncbi:type II toxin-antitoxin system VapB family antitoxin [Streptomyces sp. NPDC002758]
MSLSVVSALVRNLIMVPTAVLRNRVAKDAEVMALRHENAVLRRQIARVRYEPADRIWLAALRVPKTHPRSSNCECPCRAAVEPLTDDLSPAVIYCAAMISFQYRLGNGDRIMSRTVIDLDDAVVEEVRAALGVNTKAAAVRAALQEVVNRIRRQEFFDAMDRGEFDFSEIIETTGPKNQDGTLKRNAA